MTETKKKREWVKNAAIIFLAVLLILTFFSNTILNWSLPEVSGQYGGYGTVTTGIRGTATVQVGDLYSVSIDETREIKSVKVRQGDEVEAGQVLFILEEGDSEELEAARETLYDLEYNYNLALLKASGGDYSLQEAEIAELEEELISAIARRDRLQEYAADTDSLSVDVELAQALVDELKDEKAGLDAYEAELRADGAGDGEVIDALLKLEAATLVDEEAKAAYDDLNTLATELETAEKTVTDLEKKLSDLLTQEAEAQEDYEWKHPMLSAYKKALMRYNNANTKLANWGSGMTEAEKAAAEQELKDAKTALDALTPVTEEEVEILADRLVTYKDDIYYTTQELEQAKAMLSIANADGRDLTQLKLETAQAKLVYRETTSAKNEAQRELDKLVNARLAVIKPDVTANRSALKEAEAQLKTLKSALEKAQSYDAAVEQIADLEKSIKSKTLSLESTKKQDALNGQQEQMGLDKQLRQIEKQKEKIADMEAEALGVEVLAKYAGEVNSVSVVAGDTAKAGATLMTLGLEGKDHFMTLTVSNEQSRLVSIGDKASLNNYWWGNLDITLTAIKTDRANPTQNKILEFTVEGDVSDGQSLDITVGQRKNSYNMVVPNSAVREDANGTFILVAQAKSTPLGNRYIATRVDVTVIEKDNYNTALDAGTEFGYEYVITTSNKPIEAGSQVRLAEEQ